MKLNKQHGILRAPYQGDSMSCRESKSLLANVFTGKQSLHTGLSTRWERVDAGGAFQPVISIPAAAKGGGRHAAWESPGG